MNNQAKFSPIHPGKIIERRFFKAHNLTTEKVAQDIHLPVYQLQELVEEKRNVDTDIAGRLGLYFKVGAEGFLNLQQIYDLEIWKDRQEAMVKKLIHPYQEKKQNGRAKAV
jgi:antitoxin HigA-1